MGFAFSLQRGVTDKRGKLIISETILNINKTIAEESEGKPEYKWEDNIKLDLGEIVREVVAWIAVSRHGSVTSSFEHGNESSGSTKCRGFHY
jgi:hypothetical protein